MQAEKDSTARLKILPVCSCGHVFVHGIIYHKKVSEVESTAIKYSHNYFSPMYCPGCHRYIECIECDESIIAVEE